LPPSTLPHTWCADGIVSNSTAPLWVTSNGARLGDCEAASGIGAALVGPAAAVGLPATCWEPADAYKGRLARAYMYMSTAYLSAWVCCDTEATTAAEMKPWLLATVLQWHAAFPPTESEQKRNEVVYSDFQFNRNPFVDFPNWAVKAFT